MIRLVIILIILAKFVAGRVLCDTYFVAPHALSSVPSERQFRTLKEAAAVVRAGDVVIIHGGVYREAVEIDANGKPDAPIRFEAAPGARVVVTGTDVITDWRREPAPEGENVFSTHWPYRFIEWSPTGTHPADDYHKVIGRAEQVFINNYPLLQVLERGRLSRGTFYVDMEGRRLYVQAANNAALDTGMERVEASVRQTLWDVKGAYVHTRGIVFRYGATHAQQALARFGGVGNVVEDCVFEFSNSDGADFRNVMQVARRCRFLDNGQDGFTAGGAHQLLISDCVVCNNNTKNFNRGWGAGGCKIVLSRGVIIERSQFLRNRGIGIWFDIGNENCTVRNCLLSENEDAGLFYEISYGLYAHDNVAIFNGFLSGPAAWGANGGVSLSSSAGCFLERNLLVCNKEGLQFREQLRKTPRIAEPAGNASAWEWTHKPGDQEEWIWNRDHVIQNNVFAYNADAQVWGWWTTYDERHWPEAMQANRRERPSHVPEADFAKEYQSAIDGGMPEGLSLESLNLIIRDNVYAAAEGQGLFNWGAPWMRNRRYASLDEVRMELDIEQGGVMASPPFRDILRLDLRIPAGSAPVVKEAYPRGEVPGIMLGTFSEQAP